MRSMIVANQPQQCVRAKACENPSTSLGLDANYQVNTESLDYYQRYERPEQEIALSVV